MFKNYFVNIDKFLAFWSHYNSQIIQGLVALIMSLSVYVIFRTFFGKNRNAEAGGTVNVNTEEIEKNLQKILENQEKMKAGAQAQPPDLTQSFGNAVAGTGAESDEETMREMMALQAQVSEKQKMINDLQTQLENAKKAAAEAAANAGSSSAAASSGGGVNDEEYKALQAKYKELEEKLQEYEIISEDIADLSKFREENENLKKEVAELREKLAQGGAGSAPASSAPAASEPPPAAPADSAPAESAAPAEVEAAPADASGDAPVFEPANGELLSDDLMNAFSEMTQASKDLKDQEAEIAAATQDSENKG